ncbi:Secreted RxLR effector peptide protein [Phytophthora palmivora]|uniref:RxLR effector protein n=1 Tax=Phytophthora palmivora TaxID=4796 RepID=A0A2P4YN73_9STRA|nr:Secreted RxLR effector peptide protein [Phytophthora palmivora]
MRVIFVLLAAPTLFFCSNGAELTVLNTTSQKDIRVEGMTGRRLRSYDMGDLDNASNEERASPFDLSKLDDLMSADKIQNALKSIKNQEALFKTWHVDEATSKAVLAKLMEKDKIIENMPILTKYNDFRTRHAFNTILDSWLDTKNLDEISTALKAFKTDPMKNQFSTWYKDGITPTQFTSALNKITNTDKRKSYGALESHYKEFVKMKDKKAADAIKKAAEEMN